MKKIYFLLFFLYAASGSSQSGIIWSAPQDVAPNSFDNLHPRITMDASGDPLVIWGDNLNDKANFSRWNGSGFISPIALNPPTLPVFALSWAGPEFASKGDTVYAVFKHIPLDTNHIYLVRSFDGGVTFSSPVRVDFAADSICEFPTVDISPGGHPNVAFMKSDPGYLNARWVVAKSGSFGSWFYMDNPASYSSGGMVCDCCPATLVSSLTKDALLYRANLSNIRDTWAAISPDGSISFPNGINVDQQNWNLSSCPSSGPDGVIIGDTLYSVFMSGASGMNMVYSNKNSLTTFLTNPATEITGMLPGLSLQNYPRIAKYGSAVAQVWKQTISGTNQLALLFTSNIQNGFPAAYDTIASGTGITIANADVAIFNNEIHVVWQNDATGTVKYRKGTFGPIGINESKNNVRNISVFPNPANELLVFQALADDKNIQIRDLLGRLFFKTELNGEKEIKINTEAFPDGIFFISVENGNDIYTQKFIVEH